MVVSVSREVIPSEARDPHLWVGGVSRITEVKV